MQIPSILKKIYRWLLTHSLKSAIHEQKLQPLVEQLTEIVPDLRYHYSSIEINNLYLETKVRGQQAFQISLVEKALTFCMFTDPDNYLVDIGDSSGTHIQYLTALYPGKFKTLSVNLDKVAVKKIKEKGLAALHARAEELDKHNINADLFLSFQMLEHLHDPVGFLHSLARKTDCCGLIVTVPFLTRSRVALDHIRKNSQHKVQAEDVHIFELSPQDWRLLFRHSGWDVKYETIYLQYPQKNLLRLLKPLWRSRDYEGFLGVILTKDDRWSRLYSDW